ncbi:rRNA adenine N-6-methyltransferase family protein [Notoacmeibacter ruber]|uniref:Protein-L-isoaspartate O-methyltransferase n=1 Tax=Notoacmeibacter ruber TaxID=2670375 RepID=A0A3L7JB89_9HYPH|nr:rRNA adenine N-6-methyltransferase family protein [Notoacmeibacter ruber]RLQ88008.1 protein-L-isoaspartate O-methyltransferase [Notoacmeibacter ruber]
MMSEGFAAFALRARENGITDPALVSAFEKAGRDHFVDPAYRDAIWQPRSLPIKCGETLESPDQQIRILARLDLKPGLNVLEIGTGSGFTAAVIGAQAEKLISVERYRTLATAAAGQMKRLGFTHVSIRHGSAFDVLETGEGPFDRMIVWSSFSELPRNISNMMASGGIAVLAIGEPEQQQTVARLEKVGSRFERTDFATARMQPLAEEKALFL